MYHHRYQPQTSHPANETNNAFARNSHFRKSPSSATRDYHLSSARAPVGSATDPSTASSSASSSATYQSNNSFVGHNRIGAKNLAYHSGAYHLQPKQFAEERQDVIFRRVRGILNKITPETFDKLSKELVNVGLDSPRTLRGLIYLLFDKALKDLKYSSLYAKLCQELSERSPNFEKEPGPNTFCKFLISKCEDEFERRRKATEDFDNKNELTDEEFEQKVIAKQKMLGNIKFICELGKKRLLQEEILHECIRGLLSKKKERPLSDQAQDLECLCQIMRTIGSLLDIEASRNLMNQYFDRIDMFSRKPELPSRIRFMLRDVIDLRNNNWRPRPFQREDTVPQPLSKLREESGFNNAASNSPIDKLGNTKNLMNISDLSKLHGNKLSSLLLEDDGPSFTTTTDFHWGPSFLSHENDFDLFTGVSGSYSSHTSHTPIPIKVNNVSSSTTVSKTQLVDQAPPQTYLGQRFSQNVRPDHMMNQHQNRVDPLSKSHRSNAVRGGYNSRESTNLDEPVPSRPNDTILNRSDASLAHDRKYFSREEPRNMNSQTQHNAPSRRLDVGNNSMNQSDVREPINNHFRGNNEIRQGALQANQRDSAFRDDMRPFQGFRRPYGDSPRPLPHNRNGNHLLGTKTNLTNRQLDEMPPPPPPQPPFIHPDGPTCQNSKGQQDLNHHQIGKSDRILTQARNQDLHDNELNQRRFDRPKDRQDFEPITPRQPKFSGANYRLPGRDRPLAQREVLNRANQPPESEINLNWRSVESSQPRDTARQPTVTKSTPNAPLVDVFDPSSRFNLGQPKTNTAIDMSRKPPDSRLDEMVSDRSRIVQTAADTPRSPRQNDDTPIRGNPRGPPLHIDGSSLEDSSRLGSNRANQVSAQLSDEGKIMRRQQTEPRPTGDDNLGQQHNRSPSSRIVNRERNEPNNRRKLSERNNRASPPLPDIEADRKQAQPRAGVEKFGGREYRPAIGRERPHDSNNSSDSRRPSHWRKDGSGSNSTQANKKENTPTVSSIVGTTILPKAPTRMSETDFTLRPSHNLIGRTLPDWASQPKPKEKVEPIKEPPKIDNRQPVTLNLETPTPVQEKTQPPVIIVKEPEVDYSPENATQLQTVNKFISIFTGLLGNNTNETSKLGPKIKEMKIPKELHDECIVAVLKHSLARSEAERVSTSKLLGQLVPTIVESSALLNAFRVIFDQLHVLEVETPKVKSLVAEFLSRVVVDGLLTIEDVAQVLIGGKHHPLFLLFLQKLEKSAGQAWLSEKFIASKINLMDMLPEVDRTKERLIVALKDRCLGFLDPMLTIEPDLWAQMKDRDPSPGAIYRWIKDNVDQSIQSTPMFAHVFIACLLRYIHESVLERSRTNNNNINQQKDSDSSDSNKSSPTNSSSHGINDYEKELLSKYQQVMHALLKNKQLQLAALYALQAFYHGLDFPKGALLRWFHMLYDLSIIDDDVFFIWKEEINDEVPGKGQALFQVNTWLNWLAEAEDEEEEDA